MLELLLWKKLKDIASDFLQVRVKVGELQRRIEQLEQNIEVESLGSDVQLDTSGMKEIGVEKFYGSCLRIIIENGKCESVDCKDCPFSYKNSVLNIGCSESKLSGVSDKASEDGVLLQNAKKFIITYDSKFSDQKELSYRT